LDLSRETTNLIKHFPANLFEDLTLLFVDSFKEIGRKTAEENKEKLIDLLKIIDGIQDCEMRNITVEFLKEFE
jgi:hypothetical protein